MTEHDVLAVAIEWARRRRRTAAYVSVPRDYLSLFVEEIVNLQHDNAQYIQRDTDQLNANARAQAEGGAVPRVCKCVELTPREHNYCSDCGGAIVIYDVAPRASEAKEPELMKLRGYFCSDGDACQEIDQTACDWQCQRFRQRRQPAHAAAPAERRRTEYTPGGHPVSVVDAAPTDDAALISDIDRYCNPLSGPPKYAIELLRRCRDRLVQPAITDAEVAACLDTITESGTVAYEMQRVIRRIYRDNQLWERVNDKICADLVRKDKALRGIADAKRFDRSVFLDDNEFIAWAQNVARYGLAATPALSDTQEPVASTGPAREGE